jgi:hypothetical protein
MRILNQTLQNLRQDEEGSYTEEEEALYKSNLIAYTLQNTQR